MDGKIKLVLKQLQRSILPTHLSNRTKVRHENNQVQLEHLRHSHTRPLATNQNETRRQQKRHV